MKKRVTLTTMAITVVLLLGLFMPQQMMAQKEDQTQILKKIITLPDMQKYYPMGTDGKTKQVVIEQHPMSFPTDLALSDASTKVMLMEMVDVKSGNITSFYKFRSITTTGGSTKVVCHYFKNYNHQTNKSDIIAITAELSKSGSDWKVLNANVKGVN
jgi:hypothetical protein